MRLLALPALLPLLLVGLAAPGSTAVAAGAAGAVAAGTCQGQAVTIQGGPGRVNGTSGDDVIAADPQSSLVYTGSGDDIVCAYTGSLVVAGSGDDSVTVKPPPTGVPTQAGATFVVGQSGADRVTIVLSGTTTARAVGMTDDGDVLTLDGRDLAGGDWSADLVTGEITRTGVVVSTRTAASRLVLTLPGADRVAVTGTAEADDLAVVAKQTRHVSVELGGGDDRLSLASCRGHASGGPGSDRIRAAAPRHSSRCGHERGFRLKGGAARDLLVGSARRDTLLGGPGLDTAVGRAGTDVCKAEKKEGCER